MMLIAIYAGFAGLAFLAREEFEAWRRIHRAAWTSAWLAATLNLFFHRGEVDFQLMWLVYIWQALALRVFAHRPIVALVSVTAVTAMATHLNLTGLGPALLGSALGLWAEHSIRRRSHHRLRTALFWACFVGTFYFLLPWELTRRFPNPVSLSFAGRVGASLILVSIGGIFAHLSTKALTRRGGTPDPANAPEALCTSGIYARTRHPMQIAQVLFVWGTALLFNSSASLAYAFGFSLVLVTFVRAIEERSLLAKYGAAYAGYRMRTPAIWVRRQAASFGERSRALSPS